MQNPDAAALSGDGIGHKDDAAVNAGNAAAIAGIACDFRLVYFLQLQNSRPSFFLFHVKHFRFAPAVYCRAGDPYCLYIIMYPPPPVKKDLSELSLRGILR